MAYSAKVLADSISPDDDRLTTLEVTYPRIIHSEVLTHRAFSRSSASSRAIPVLKQIERVVNDPFIPPVFGKNRPGMQATETVAQAKSERAWKTALAHAVDGAQRLANLGVHKQLANRLLEPFSWITVIISAAEWQNFFDLRISPNAQPEMQQIASMMRSVINANVPDRVCLGEWHMPLVQDRDQLSTTGYTPRDIRRISAARCARVSYLNHDGTRDPSKDLLLADRLEHDGHWSPFEHVATPGDGFANFRGWEQLRHHSD